MYANANNYIDDKYGIPHGYAKVKILFLLHSVKCDNNLKNWLLKKTDYLAFQLNQ